MKRVVTKELKLNSRTIKMLNQDQLKTVVGGLKNDEPTTNSSCPTSNAAGSAGCGGTGGGTPDPM